MLQMITLPHSLWFCRGGVDPRWRRFQDTQVQDTGRYVRSVSWRTLIYTPSFSELWNILMNWLKVLCAVANGNAGDLIEDGSVSVVDEDEVIPTVITVITHHFKWYFNNYWYSYLRFINNLTITNFQLFCDRPMDKFKQNFPVIHSILVN